MASESDKRGLSGPMRALAWGALLSGCALAAIKVAAFAQELQLPTILRPSTVPVEVIDGPDSSRGRRAPRDPLLLPRAPNALPNPTRRNVRAAAHGADATQKVKTTPLRRTGAPQLTTPAPPPLRRRPLEIDPYAQVGVNVGSFTIRPAIELDAGYDSNPNRLPGPVRGSGFLRPGAELRADSNWSTHSFQALMRGGYGFYGDVPSANRPEVDARANWRFDVTRSTQVLAETRFRLDAQSPLTTNLPYITTSRPLTYQYGATLGIEHRINRATVGLRGNIDRYTYDDADIPGGGVIDQSDRNYNQIGGALRLGYELTPGVRPFVEASADTRIHNQRIDDSGYARNSNGLTARIGTTLDFNRTLIGEISGGYGGRKYEDPRLAELRGLIGDISLIWSASPLTAIGLRAQTSLDESTTPGVSGILTRKATVEIAHAFLRNLTLTGAGSFQRADYQGVPLVEDTINASVRLDYKLSRTVSVRAAYRHERFLSTTPGADYTANIFTVGLRLQR